MSRSQAARDRSRAVFKVKKPHFFKIILENTLDEKRLRIPKKFLRLHGHTLTESVLLKLPCGSVWRIGLEKRDGGVWLGHGWLRFAESYSIVRGHMLVFEYQGNSEFSLVIFNDTTCEIDYPLVADNRGDVDFEGDRQVPEKGESLKKRERPTKTIDDKTGGGKFRAIRCGKADILQRAKPLGPSEVKQALARVSGFTSDKPFFKIVMQPSYVLRSRMSIPSSFAKAHLKQRSCNASLEVLGERSWPLKYSSGVYKTSRKYATARFFSGWRAFAQDNSLDIGDACVFALTKNSDKKIAFQVTIFRSSNQNANPS